VAQRYSNASVKTFLQEAGETICDEIFMVPLSTLDDPTTNAQEDP
jgi:hypothetical protein